VAQAPEGRDDAGTAPGLVGRLARQSTGKGRLKPSHNSQTEGCYDGIEDYGINRNQGAESTLAYWISHLVVAAELRS